MEWNNKTEARLSDLIGKTLFSVVNTGDEVRFETTDGEVYKLLHFQDCCEDVRVEEIIGDLNDLIGTPILSAEESSGIEHPPTSYEDSSTWTFYKFATIHGYVDIRWWGRSNGYYSESVDFIKG